MLKSKKKTFAILFATILFFVSCSEKKIKGSNIVGDWHHEISQNMGGYEISIKTKLNIVRNGPGDYEYNLKETTKDAMYGNQPKTMYSKGKLNKDILEKKWRFIGTDYGSRGGYILVPSDNWVDYKPTELQIEFNIGSGKTMIFTRKTDDSNSIQKITFSEAEAFMKVRCNEVNQTLMKKKSVVFNGTKLYMFLSVARDGQACISSISENKLEVFAADCGEAMVKIQQWNAVN